MTPPKHTFPILYVEDEENDILLLEHAWREASIQHPLQVVHNGQEALDYFQSIGPFDNRSIFPMCGLVLLDLNLPVLSGFEVLSWVRKKQDLKRVPILVFTSSNQLGDIQLAYELGANAFLIKPASINQLVQLVRSVKDFWLLQNTFPRLET